MMKTIRRLLGVLVMIAGVLGLLLSVGGVVAVWAAKPTATSFVETTFGTLFTSLDTSITATEITGEALSATIDSLDALTTMLGSTAASVEETKPVLDQIDSFLGESLPDTLTSASTSLRTAQQAAVVLESTIQSLEAFQSLLGAVPLLGSMVSVPEQSYAPEVPLADSLGNLATDLEKMPEMFVTISTGLSGTDDNLDTIQNSLEMMTSSVTLIAESLGGYETMIGQSLNSLDNLKTNLVNIENQMTGVVNGTAIGLSLVLFWLLMAQVVILSQGWELYQGTANRMESASEQENAKSEDIQKKEN
jgi:flagellin-like hook-associated protein FlgL